jgi:hypothetical protein
MLWLLIASILALALVLVTIAWLVFGTGGDGGDPAAARPSLVEQGVLWT